MRCLSLTWPRAVALAFVVSALFGGPAMSQGNQHVAGPSGWVRKDHVRAFYSGHSLSEGIPEVVEQIALSLGLRMTFEVQVKGYSLLRQRTKGELPQASDWSGYKAGQNRNGSGLDVAAELKQPSRLPPGEKYDALVVTERHDLPAIARTERTAHYLVDISKRVLEANPATEIFFYHTWLGLDHDAPDPWIAYERAVSAMWECVASRANLDLAASARTQRIRVLPGASALAELVAALRDNKVPGLTASTVGARVGLLFSDDVHMSDIGRYYMGLVHFAVLYGRTPEGAKAPSGLSAEAARSLQSRAWAFATVYGQRAHAAARMDMAACRDLMRDKVCPAYTAFRNSSALPGVAAIRRSWDRYQCGRTYSRTGDKDNPFAPSAD